MNVLKNIFIVLLIGGVVLLPGCGGDGPGDPGQSNNGDSQEQARVLGLMKSGTWKLQTLTVDGVDQSASFPNMTLTFTDAGFTSTNGKDVWPAAGTWSFAPG